MPYQRGQRIRKTPEFKESVSLQRFRMSIDNIEANIQLIDAAFIQVSEKLNTSIRVDKEADMRDVLGLSKSQYTKLNHPIKQHSVILSRVKRENIGFGLIQLYNSFSVYLKGVLTEMIEHKPNVVMGKAVTNKAGEAKDNLTFTFADIIRLGDYEKIQEQMVNRIFRRLEDEQSTITLLSKILDDTKVNIPNEEKSKTLAYLEMRHLLTHSGGIADAKFARAHGNMFVPAIITGNKLPLKIHVFQAATVQISSFCKLVDSELLRNDMIPERKYIQGQNGIVQS